LFAEAEMVARWSAWTRAERETACDLSQAGATPAAIAAELGRTVPGVLWQLNRLGARRRGYVRRVREGDWSSGEDGRAVEMLVTGGMTLRAIGAELGRTEAAVSARLKRLGVPVPRRKHTRCSVCLPPVYVEPTEEELDALIAEQMRNLPAWWLVERERQRREDEYLDRLTDAGMRETSVVRQRGRGLSAEL